jgi:hypothetical protein
MEDENHTAKQQIGGRPFLTYFVYSFLPLHKHSWETQHMQCLASLPLEAVSVIYKKNRNAKALR